MFNIFCVYRKPGPFFVSTMADDNIGITFWESHVRPWQIFSLNDLDNKNADRFWHFKIDWGNFVGQKYRQSIWIDLFKFHQPIADEDRVKKLDLFRCLKKI